MSKYAWNTLVVLQPELFFSHFFSMLLKELAERGLHHVSRIAEATMSHVFSIESLQENYEASTPYDSYDSYNDLRFARYVTWH